MTDPVWRKAEMLVEETQQAIETQRSVIAALEKRGMDATIARKHLRMLEETSVRRIEIRDETRRKREKRLSDKKR